jgi:hypothetical protein
MLKKPFNYALVAILIVLGGCSTVGPGFANHPADCAIGIAWADCLPGTHGYANGGGSMHRKEAEDAANSQMAAITDQQKAAHSQCIVDLQTPELDPLRHKIELTRSKVDEAPPFEFASLDVFPTPAERPLIAKWAYLRDDCVKRARAIEIVPPKANALDVAFIRQQEAFAIGLDASVSQLIVALYQMKLTYGEFAQRRYDMGKAAADAQRQYRETSLINDQQRKLQAQQVASEQYANSLSATANYIQAVNARRPRTVSLESIHCTSTANYNIVNTNCN